MDGEGRITRDSDKFALIQMVRENEILWNSCHPEYHDRSAAANVWISIGNKLQFSGTL